MKNIEEIDTSLYYCYFLTDTDKEVVLKTNTPAGLIDVHNYDLFSTSYGTLIAFDKKNVANYFNYYYSYDLENKHIQSSTYESTRDFFDQGIDGPISMFVFLDSIQIASKDAYIIDENLPEGFQRCDHDKYGPIAFYESSNQIDVKSVHSLLDVAGIGHLVCFVTSHNENPNFGSQSTNAGARTLSGAIKTIYEWSTSYEEPFNNQENIANKANLFLKEVNFPENVLNDIINSQVDMRVARYLKGETRPGYHIDEVTETPESLKDFYKTRCRYMSLFNIQRNHPNGSAIPDSVVANEIKNIENDLYLLCAKYNLFDFSSNSIENALNSDLFKDDSLIAKSLYSRLKEYYGI